jgi:pimeloyl-ACP methyl ester carboxylesterase
MASKTKSIVVLIFVDLLLALQLFASDDREQSIQLPNGVRLRFVEQGNQAATPIIFLHGYTDSWRSFENVLSLFPKKFHVIAISQRGHGDSDRPDAYHLHNFAGDLAQFVTMKRLRPGVIVGHSLGGLVAQQFAIDYPGLTKAIIIESSAPSFADNDGVPEFLSDVMKLTDPIDRQFAEAFQSSTIAKPLPPGTIDVYVNESTKVPAQVWHGIASEILVTDYTGDLHKIKVPVLIMWGDKDAFCSWADQDEFARLLPASRLIVYEGFGHALHWEDPSRYVKDVIRFFKCVSK